MQTVRPGGSADRAGIREKDVIVKVNGKHVTQSTHSEVVELIAGKSPNNQQILIMIHVASKSQWLLSMANLGSQELNADEIFIDRLSPWLGGNL